MSRVIFHRISARREEKTNDLERISKIKYLVLVLAFFILDWPIDWFRFCLDLFMAFIFTAERTLNFRVAASLDFCFVLAIQLVWSPLADVLQSLAAEF